MKFNKILDKFKKGSHPVPSVITLYKDKKKRLSRLSIKDLDLLEGKNVPDLLKKYPLTPSKTKVLDKLVKDYRKGNLSLSGSTTSKYKRKKLNKDKLNKIIEDYEEAKKKKRNSLSLRIIDKFKDLDVSELKRKFSWTSSREKLYNQMINDYYDRKISLSNLSNKSRFDPSRLSKGKINKLLEDYDAKKKTMKSSSSLLESYTSTKKRSKLSIDALKNIFKN